MRTATTLTATSLQVPVLLPLLLRPQLRDDTVTDNDLLRLGVTKEFHRRRFLREAPFSCSVGDNDLGLGHIAGTTPDKASVWPRAAIFLQLWAPSEQVVL